MEFSIFIPTYEMRGKGVRFLSELFESLKSQTCQDFEVIVSDHSKNNDICKLCEEWKNIFTLRYFRNTINSVVIQTAQGGIIKPMDQDDSMGDKDCLLKIGEGMLKNPKASRGTIGCTYIDERGENISDAAVSARYLRAGRPPISTLFYKKTGRFSKPLMITDTLVNVRTWPFRSSMYVLTKQLSPRDKGRMTWRRIKRMLKKLADIAHIPVHTFYS